LQAAQGDDAEDLWGRGFHVGQIGTRSVSYVKSQRTYMNDAP
jgi:hypothetical protein